MSATLDGARFAALMGAAPVIESEGRSHPLDLRYLGRRGEARIEDEMAAAIRTALAEGAAGEGLLAFLPGVAEIERVDRYRAPIVLEGGSIHADGEGTLLTTEECLLNPNRNPGLTREQIEAVLSDYLSVEKFIWLGRGVYEDETNGHVDNICCFVRPGVVALTWTDDKADPQYEISRDAFERLSAATDAKGRKLEIHRIHQPDPVLITAEESSGVDTVEGSQPRTEGMRLAASYINFYIANGVIVMPSFGDPHDEPAREQIAALFPERRVIAVPAREILLGGGNIHCITQQQPAPRGKS